MKIENRVILLVEDNSSDVELTRRALLKENIMNEVIVVEDGQEALDYMFGEGIYHGRDVSVQPALILLDINLPIIDGIEVLKRLRADARTRKQIIVILTSSKEEQDLIKSYDLGVNSYIRKPVDFNQFSEAIKYLGLYWLVINEPPPSRSVSYTHLTLPTN
jgi:CheY-like chemotaxis protein